MSITAGTQLGRYVIRSPLGAGGMGEVYFAWDTQLERAVALKILSSEVSTDHARLRRFIQEAKALSAINHPNILTVYEIGQSDSIYFIATEFIDGKTLRKRVTDGAINIDEALGLAAQVADALTAAHATGIVHRDVKPENIMLRQDGFVKLLDFGLARLTELRVDSRAVTLFKTTPGTVLGTVTYMSPEQARGLEVDARTDIWSLGVVLYEMLVGRRPFEGATATDLIVSILARDPPPLTSQAGEVPNALKSIVAKMLAKNREERYQTARLLALNLRNLQQRAASLSKLKPSEETQVSIGATAAFPKQEVSNSASSNLPVQLTRFIGREAELRAIEDLMQRDDVRLLTLTGTGGTGKTRLSLQLAARLSNSFVDGAYFVRLAAISDSEHVESAIAMILGVREAGGVALIARLKEYLQHKQLLLILDNFEQVIGAAPLISQFLSTAEGLKVLVTSREPLRIRGEHEYAVAPLQTPDLKQKLTTETLAQYPSVELFVQRARAVKPDFALDSQNAHAVAEVCTRLDGLPLAIELAAARIKTLSPDSMLPRLENRLRLLTRGPRELPAKEQTMRGAIDWSYDLLNHEEKELFRRLSVFVGGCTLEAAERVSTVSGDLSLHVLDGLASLVDKSLLRPVEDQSEPRFSMLETIREYGLEQLSASGEADVLRQQHARFFYELTDRIAPDLTGLAQASGLDRLEAELDNLREALEWSLNFNPGAGLELAVSLWHLWTSRNHFAEGRKWLEEILKIPEVQISPLTRAKALALAGILAHRQNDLAAANALSEESLAKHKEIGDEIGIGYSLQRLGLILLSQGDYASARSYFEEALALGKKLDNERLIAQMFNCLGEAARFEGDYATAHTFYEECLTLLRQLGDTLQIAYLLANLADVASNLDAPATAFSLYKDSLTLGREVGDKRHVGTTLDGLAALAASQGEPKRAARLLGAAESLYECVGSMPDSPDLAVRNRAFALAQCSLSEEAFAAAFGEGKEMMFEEAVDYALNWTIRA